MKITSNLTNLKRFLLVCFVFLLRKKLRNMTIVTAVASVLLMHIGFCGNFTVDDLKFFYLFVNR